jgi:HEAT repeat protein
VTIALISLWIAIGAVALTTGLAISLRTFAALTGARRERYRVVVAEGLAAYAVGAADDPPPAPSGRLQQRVMHDELARLAPNLKGDSRRLLTDAFVSYGLIGSVTRDLRSAQTLTAIRAAELAGVMHLTDCVPILVERLGAEPLMRLACARALAEIGASDAVPRIVDSLTRGGNAVELGEILMSFGVDAEPILRERLREASTAPERRLAAVTLGEIHAYSAVGDLEQALADADPELRAAAARALGKIGEHSATSTLIEELDRAAPPFVGVAAATALGQLDHPLATPALVRALSAADWELRNAAARSLVAFGDRGVNEVVAHLDQIPVAGIAHFAGLLDVADRMGSIIDRAADGDARMDRLARAACASGVRSRLEECAAHAAGPACGYAAAVLRDARATA